MFEHFVVIFDAFFWGFGGRFGNSGTNVQVVLMGSGPQAQDDNPSRFLDV